MKDFLSLQKKYKRVRKQSIVFFLASIRELRKYVILFPALFFLIILFCTHVYRNVLLKSQSIPITTLPFSIANVVQNPYPSFSSVLGASSADVGSVVPELSAQAAVIMDDNSKVILYSKNAGLQFSMASTTKIMTAITALEYFSLEDTITVFDDHVEGATVGFSKGEQVRFEDMLYGLLLPSGNDAAKAIAQNYPGGEVKFVEKMNENAERLFLYHTHYSDPTGLEDDGNYTTVVDLARLASVAMKNTLFAHIVGTKTYSLTTVNTHKTYAFHNLNKLLGTDGVVGIKTGFTDQAGEVLVTSKQEKEHKFIIVIMKSKDRFGDTQKLLSFIDGNILFTPLGVSDR